MSARPRGRAALVLWSALVPALATVTFLPAFTGGPAFVAVLLAAVVVPFAVVAVGARLRVPAWVVAAATTSLVLLAAVTSVREAVAQPDDAPPATGWRASALGEALGPVADAVARLLTAPRPAAPTPVHAVPMLVLVALVALAVALSVARRTTPGAGPLVGGAVLYAAALLLTAGGADPHGLVAALLVGVSAAGWVLLDRQGAPDVRREAASLGRAEGRARRRWRPATPAALAVVLVAASATAIGGALTRAEAFEPREHVTPPVVPVDATHPLPQLALWAAEPDQELLVARGALPERLALVVLPDFDGATWRSASSLRPAGAVASPALPPGEELGRMDVTVELRGLATPALGTGTWLPTAGTPVTVSVPDALWDVETGSLVAPDGVPADGTYRVTADVDQPTAATLARAGVPSGPEVERYLALPRFPADMQAYARELTAGAPSRLEQARAIEETVRAERELAPDAVSGSSYARVREFLFAEPDQGGQIGTAEQFASSFAVLARAAGLPSRLVLGFVLPEPDPDGTVVVRGEHAHVWPEIYLAGAGWVAFDPSPSVSGSAGERDTDALEVGTDGPLEPVEEQETSVPEPAPEPAPAPDDATTTTPATAVLVLVAVLATAGLAVLAVVVCGVLRRLRSRRLRRQGALGAWQHVEDTLVLAGAPPRPGEHAGRVAARVGDGAPGEAARRLAVLAERAAFGPGQAAGGADDAWALAREVERATRRGASRRARLVWSWHPAPLGRPTPPERRVSG